MTENQMALYLETLTKIGLEATAAKAAGVTLGVVEQARQDNPGFNTQVNDAIEGFNDSLEKEAIRRARDGIDKPVYYKGERVDSVREYSDTLLAKLLTGRRPKVYGDKREISGPGAGAIVVKFAEFDDDLDGRL